MPSNASGSQKTNNMRYVPTLLALFLLAILAMCASGCASVTYHDKGGATLHVASFFGDA